MLIETAELQKTPSVVHSSKWTTREQDSDHRPWNPRGADEPPNVTLAGQKPVRTLVSQICNGL